MHLPLDAWSHCAQLALLRRATSSYLWCLLPCHSRAGSTRTAFTPNGTRPALQAPASCLWCPCWQAPQRQQQALLCCLSPPWSLKHPCCQSQPCRPLLPHLCSPSCWHPRLQQCCRLLRRRHLWLCHPLLLGALCQPSALHRHLRQCAPMCHRDLTSRASSRWACLLQRSLCLARRQACLLHAH